MAVFCFEADLDYSDRPTEANGSLIFRCFFLCVPRVLRGSISFLRTQKPLPPFVTELLIVLSDVDSVF